MHRHHNSSNLRTNFKLARKLLLTAAFSSLLNSLDVLQAEEIKDVVVGECVPHDKERGPWNCKLGSPEPFRCLAGQIVGYDTIWATIGSSQQAIEMLQKKYAEINDLRKFSQWSACQGFHVTVFHSGYPPEEKNMNLGIIYFLKSRPPFPLPWYFIFTPYSGVFQFTLDEYGKIVKASHNYITE